MSDLLLIQNALREATRPRRLLIALLLIALPAALGVAWRLLSPGSGFVPGDVYDTLAVSLIFGFTLPLLSVIYGTGVVSQEIEGRTIIYLLTRPHPRWRILLAKWLVALLVVAVITTLATVLLALVTFGFSNMANAGVDADIYALLMGTLAYGALFLLLGTAIPRPLTYGLLFVFGWEALVAVLPGQFGRVSIGAYLRALAAREAVETTSNNPQNFLLSLARGQQVKIPTAEAWWVLSAVTIVCLTAALIIFSRREYSPREDAE